MASIHYIWWGNPGTPQLEKNATATPNIMVQNVHGTHDVHYWIGGNKGFNGKLDERIIQHDLKKDPGAVLLGSTPHSVKYAGKFNEILKSLDQFRAFAATKDLVSLAVMYSQTGYFFDTTTQIGVGYRPHLRRLLCDGPLPRAPYSGKDADPNSRQYVRDDESADFTARFGFGPMGMAGLGGKPMVMVPAFDIWAMYSPKKYNSAFSTALASYIRRAEQMGFLSPDNTQVDLYGKSLSSVMNTLPTDQQKQTAGYKSARDAVIGGMAISSLTHGLDTYARLNGKLLKDLGWPYVELVRVPEKQVEAPKETLVARPQQGTLMKLKALIELEAKKNKEAAMVNAIFAGMGEANVTIPQIGIQKWFSGSWRAKNL